MRSVGRFVLITFICAWMAGFSGGQMAAAAESADKKENVKIHWAFGALTGAGSKRELVRIERDTALKTGDQLKMMVELKSMCFVYLIYHGSNNEIQLLFPNTLKQFNADYRIAQQYYIPRRDLWFALDERTGLETFYLLVSKTRSVSYTHLRAHET